MKKLPVCKACINASLCIRCQENFDKGYVTQFDLDLANDFLELEKKEFPELKKASFYNAVDVEKIVFFVIGQGHKTKFTPELLKKMQEMYAIPKIILIEKGSVKSMIQQIITPAKLLGVNQIYLPTGETEFKVIVLNEDKEKMEKKNLHLLEQASSLIIRGITKIEFQ